MMSNPFKRKIDLDKLANDLYQKGQIHLLETELEKINQEDLDKKEQEKWHELYGIAAFQAKKRKISLKRFQEGFSRFPDSASLAFSLGQEYEFSGNVQKMIELFNKAPFPKVSAQHSLAAARYCYLWNEYDKGITYLMPIINAYYGLKILDDTFLYIRGLPFFSQTWDYIAAFCYLKNNFDIILEITSMVTKECSDYNFDILQKELEAIMSKDYLCILDSLNERIKLLKEQKIPSGYTQLRVNVLLSQKVPDISVGEKLLDEVVMSADDFTWLEDMRLLAKCNLYHKQNDEIKEKESQNILFQKQPLLFEPDHALNFNLLDYQEKLKKIYQKQRIANHSSS